MTDSSHFGTDNHTAKARNPMPIGRTITAIIEGTTTYQVSLTRTPDFYRVTVLDAWGSPVDPAWNRNLGTEEQARHYARATTLTFRHPHNAPVATRVEDTYTTTDLAIAA